MSALKSRQLACLLRYLVSQSMNYRSELRRIVTEFALFLLFLAIN